MPNKSNNRVLRYLFFEGRECPFLHMPSCEFGKSANSQGGVCEILRSITICLATIGVCVFRCVNFGWRTFLFILFYGGYYGTFQIACQCGKKTQQELGSPIWKYRERLVFLFLILFHRLLCQLHTLISRRSIRKRYTRTTISMRSLHERRSRFRAVCNPQSLLSLSRTKNLVKEKKFTNANNHYHFSRLVSYF